jgi:hypothetical protein
MAERIPRIITRGTKTFMILLYKKFCTHWVPFAPSAASRFLLIDSILLLRARSNLSACTTSNVHDHVSLPGPTTLPLRRVVFILHDNVFMPNAWVNNDLILIFIQTLVHGLTTNFVIGLDLYTSILPSIRLQVINQVVLIGWLMISVHLFFNRIVICGLDHWATSAPSVFSCPASHGDSSIARSIPGTSQPLSVHVGYW